ncbi:MAG: ABC transporter permease [Muribaculaceae bacterium]|nr:ABC transporter permease [Muribaculaceae bacterium]MDE6611849.1 ABC transporter permease [Muribaculaceae bacterium]
MKSALSIIISREYLERVKRKSFIISTLLVPVLMIALMFAPAAIMLLDTPESKTVAVIDDSGLVAQRLKDNDQITFTDYKQPLDSARADNDVEAILVIGRKVIDNPNANISLYFRGAPSLATDSYISGQLTNAIEDIRLEAYNIDNIRQILDEVKVNLSYPTIRLDQEEEKSTSSALSYIIALVLDMMLYMFILIYGNMVMTSIIEEKNNRVLEIVVSSVKPSSLMLGKIIGIGLVAITQILIWGVIIGACSAWAVPMLSSIPEAAQDAEIMGAIGQLADLGYVGQLMFYMILFFIGGYLFYSAIYAALGSAVDNVQDASQLSTIATMPVIIGIVTSMSAVQNPGSTLAFWVSIIPFTSPMAMMSRLPFGVPMWEIILSLVLLYASFLLLIWLCAKIYRVGIFMYGKKPTFAEIIRWARYK